MKQHDRDRARNQRRLRERRGERAFLFDAGLERCLGEVERTEWEDAVSIAGGDVAEAAHICGLGEVPKGARALWGTSAEAARATFVSWQRRRRT